MNKLTIDRNKWVRGTADSYASSGSDYRTAIEKARDNIHKFGSSYLENSYGNMCCLGFYSKACGVEDIQIIGLPSAYVNMRKTIPECFKPFIEDAKLEWGYEGSHLQGQLIRVNDDASLTEQERETRIKQLFATIGVEVEFIN